MYKRQDDLLRGVPGIGPVTAATLLAALPNVYKRQVVVSGGAGVRAVLYLSLIHI